MSRKYYQCWFRLNACDTYLIWFGDERDGVVINDVGKVVCYSSAEKLLCQASFMGLLIERETPILHDFDRLVAWLDLADTKVLDCKLLLEVWNLFQDVSDSINGGFDADRRLTSKIYSKLFFGNNLSVITPSGKNYQPTWSTKELKIMREILGFGLSLFKESMVIL